MLNFLFSFVLLIYFLKLEDFIPLHIALLLSYFDIFPHQKEPKEQPKKQCNIDCESHQLEV